MQVGVEKRVNRGRKIGAIVLILFGLWSGAFDVSNTLALGCIDFFLMPEGYAREI